eukprot:scaffold13776_cov97-Skeletonema_marinoi.AAC.2
MSWMSNGRDYPGEGRLKAGIPLVSPMPNSHEEHLIHLTQLTPNIDESQQMKIANRCPHKTSAYTS